MKRIIFNEPMRCEVVEVDKPTINDNQVLLKNHVVGICGSDMQIYHGKHPSAVFPLVPGHEVAAEIVEIGKNVKEYKIGDKVTVEPQVFCGHCYPCQIGRFNVCEQLKVLGVHLDGFMQEYTAVDAKYLHACPESMPYNLIALVEPLAVAVGAVKRINYKGVNIVVVGAGPIGNAIAQSAQALGAAKVLLTDIVDEKLAFAKKCGVKHCENTKDISLDKVIEKTFGTRKADCIIDAAATTRSFISIIDAARPRSDIVITGNYKMPVELVVPKIQRREINLIGHMMYIREDFADAIRFLQEKKVNLDTFVTQEFIVDEISTGLDYVDNNPANVIKSVIKF